LLHFNRPVTILTNNVDQPNWRFSRAGQKILGLSLPSSDRLLESIAQELEKFKIKG